MSEKLSQTAEMLQRIHALEELAARVPALELQVQTLQQNIVNTCAAQMQHLFTNPVMVDSLAHRFFVAAANAFAFKARASNEKPPELVVVEGYIPGSLRAILNEDGTIGIEQQLKGATGANSAWESANAEYEEKGILTQFAELLSAYGANAGRVYFITDSVTLQNHREEVARSLASSAAGAPVEEEPSPEAEPVRQLLIYVEEEGVLENGLSLESDATVIIDAGNGLARSASAGELVAGDKFSYQPANSDVIYEGTVKSIEDTTDWTTDAVALPKAQVEVTFKPLPFSDAVEGVDADAPTLTQELDYDAEFNVTTETGTVTKQAQELARGDVVAIARNGQVIRETVVEVRPVVQTAEASVA